VKDVSFINNCIRLSKAIEYICHVISTTLKGGSNNLESFIIKQLVDNKKLMKININHKTKIMNLKRIFGALLTALGIGGLIYTAVIFAGTSGETRDVKSLIIYGILGIIFLYLELV
jgi:hypothetical protein